MNARLKRKGARFRSGKHFGTNALRFERAMAGFPTAKVPSAPCSLSELVGGELRYVGQLDSPSDARVTRAIARILKPRAQSPFSDTISQPWRSQFAEMRRKLADVDAKPR